MATKFTPTQGMKLYFMDDTGSPPVVAKVDQATGVTGLGGKRKKIDITNQDSVGFTENAPGLMDAGEASFSLIWDFTNDNQVLVARLAQGTATGINTGNNNRAFYLASSDNTTAPTWNGSLNELVPPVSAGKVGRSGLAFLGYFSNFTVDSPTDDVIKVQCGVQLSGALTIYQKGKNYP